MEFAAPADWTQMASKAPADCGALGFTAQVDWAAKESVYMAASTTRIEAVSSGIPASVAAAGRT
jgi:hypothetical protein